MVTAVKAPADDGDQPSRFLTELGVEPRDVTGRPRRPLAVAALVAELRATTVDPGASPALREAAAQRLARLAALPTTRATPLVPAAHPYRWWGLDEPTRAAVPLRDRDRPVALSGSALDQLANTCSLQWFLGREVKADAPATAAQGFGNVVHVLADEVASGRTPADLAVLMERLDSVWDGLAFDAPWKSRQEKDNARDALERFLRWHVMDRGRPHPVGQRARVRRHPRSGRVRQSASAAPWTGSRRDTAGPGVRRRLQDRQRGADQRRGRPPPPARRLPAGGPRGRRRRASSTAAVPTPGGAELVQLRQGAPQKEGGDALPKVQAQEPLAGEWVGDLLATAAGRVLDERFTPTTGQHCAHCTFRASCSAQPEGRQIME